MYTKGSLASEKCAGILQKYKVMLAEHNVRRTGVKTHGICLLPIRKHDQNVLEHSCLATFLGGSLEMTFEELGPYFDKDWWMMMLIHDTAETKTGDLADDGSHVGINKDEEEYKFIRAFVDGFIEERAEDICSVFGGFQKKDNIYYMIDKMEWILFVGCLTPLRHAGSMRFKRLFYKLTDQDKHAIELTGSRRVVDAMVVHFMEHTHGIPGRDVFIGLIETLYLDIDGVIPDFVEKLY
jgi:5'-deoxynucleotidase YfbR-like HD superfamily hydrolase